MSGDMERLRAEAASLRRALQDAELEIQHMGDTHQKQLRELLMVTHCSHSAPLMGSLQSQSLKAQAQQPALQS